MLNPDRYLRTAYSLALEQATQIPVFAKSIPAGLSPSPKRYIVMDSQSKSQTVKAKVNYFEWLARININIYSINDAGNFAPIFTDDIEQIVLNTILPGIQVDGFYNKNTDLVSTQDLGLDFKGKSVDRKLLIFEHWLCEKL